MFCPACGFEYAQKTNYCKRCGESLGVPSDASPPKIPRSRITSMFWAIAMFCVMGLVTVFKSYDRLVNRGVHGDELLLPFVMGIFLIGAVAVLLIWMLARMITAHQQMGRSVVVEKHYIRETPPAQFGAASDAIQQAVEPSSVVEHTTRQLVGR